MIEFTNEHLCGILPLFLSVDDPRPAKQQIHESYAHGGGWHEFKGFTLHEGARGYELQYPEDPPMKEMAGVL